MNPYVLSFQETRKESIALVGGKGANLGELTRAGLPVPEGFCITTAAFQALLDTSSEMAHFLRALDELDPTDLEGVGQIGQEMRLHIESLAIPPDIHSAVIEQWTRLGSMHAYAVRSSATAEDLPTASFAGQQETFLNVKGELQLFAAIRACWASLFSDRAIVYRMNNGFDHRAVLLSIVVQQMVFPEVSGILFTADPVNGHRGITTIEASLGLGEALVSGLVSPDRYQIKDGSLYDKHISTKKIAIHALAQGGTLKSDIPAADQTKQALPDERILELASLGKQIESHYGTEQDIEWALADGNLYILQARPITSLFPIPDISDKQFHVFLSFGHQQMMTEAMSPMAISIWKQLMPSPENRRRQSLVDAGGRLFIDPTDMLHYDFAQKLYPKIMSQMDELMSMALTELLKRDEFKKTASIEPLKEQLFRAAGPLVTVLLKDLLSPDSGEHVYSNILEFMRKRVRETKEQLSSAEGAQRIHTLEQNAGKLMMDLFMNDIHYFAAGSIAFQLIQLFCSWWIQPPEDLSPLQKSLPHNVTAEMGLRLGDLADAVRPYPELIRYLQEEKNRSSLEGLSQIEGGEKFRAELATFLQHFGARCPGEIDLAKPRWREDPSMLLSSILGHLRTVESGEHRERFKKGAALAEETAQRILDRVKDSMDGEFKHSFLSRLISLYRNMGGLRENHKFVIVLHFDIYKKALLEEAQKLVEEGGLNDKQDIFFLSLQELKALLEKRFPGDLPALLQSRKQAYEHYQKLTPPRVMTSEGEIVIGKRDLSSFPEGAHVGTPVSPGMVEGYARIVLKPETASLSPDEIMIAPFTDPGWTPLFHQAKGLVMEVGGMMTHGAVVAREYGIPAVAGIDGATRLIRDGQRIRLDGTHGYLLVIEDDTGHEQGK